MGITPAEYLDAIARKPSRRIVGLMSGTSFDALDIALVDVEGAGDSCMPRLRAWKECPFTPMIREKIDAMNRSTGCGAEEVCILHAYLGHLYADHVRGFLSEEGVDVSDIDLIGMHGQTVRHLPEPRVVEGKPIRSTLQIGSGPTVAALLGIPVISDFRAADMALGGEGAPLVPYADYLLFRSAERDRVLLNIGGIANLTRLRKGCTRDRIIAFDTGPGNMILDNLAQRLFDVPFDRNGSIARTGIIRDPLLARLLSDDYLRRPYPKSTGRERFGAEFAGRLLEINDAEYRFSSTDVMATATAFTAEAIRIGIRLSGEPWPDEVIVSGGGAMNAFLMELLAERVPAAIRRIDDLGIPAGAKESVCFALFANEWLFGNTINIPSVTGAARSVMCGSISLA